MEQKDKTKIRCNDGPVLVVGRGSRGHVLSKWCVPLVLLVYIAEVGNHVGKGAEPDVEQLETTHVHTKIQINIKQKHGAGQR